MIRRSVGSPHLERRVVNTLPALACVALGLGSSILAQGQNVKRTVAPTAKLQSVEPRNALAFPTRRRLWSDRLRPRLHPVVPRARVLERHASGHRATCCTRARGAGRRGLPGRILVAAPGDRSARRVHRRGARCQRPETRSAPDRKRRQRTRFAEKNSRFRELATIRMNSRIPGEVSFSSVTGTTAKSALTG